MSRGKVLGMRLWVWLAAVVLIPGAAVYAASEAEVLSQARASLQSGAGVGPVCMDAVQAMRASGLSVEGTSGALAETLLRAGIESGRDGVALGVEIAEGLLAAFLAAEVPPEEVLRAMSSGILGLRAAAARAGLDQAALQAAIEQRVAGLGLSDELAAQLAALIPAAFAAEVAETYTAPPTAPAAPARPPTQVSDFYDPTVSPSQ